MATNPKPIHEILPKNGLLFPENLPGFVLCKPKLMPLKSMTLERLEKMQREAQDTLKDQEMKEREEQREVFQQADMVQEGSHQRHQSDATWQLNRSKEGRYDSGPSSLSSSDRPSPRDMKHDSLDNNAGDDDYKSVG